VRNQFLPHEGELRREIATVTDWYTDVLFGLPGIALTRTPISRVVVDLERYVDDDLEKNAAFGQGVIYTHNTLGDQIRRELSPKELSLLLDSCRDMLQQQGYSVEVDFPYSGCLVPERYHRDAPLPAIMMEINRCLYLKPSSRECYRLGDMPVRLAAFDTVKNDIWIWEIYREVMPPVRVQKGC